MQLDHVVRRLDYSAPQHVRNAVASLGRTEDVRFSPSNRRLAVAGYWKNTITVFEVSIEGSKNSKSIALTDVAEISSTSFKRPHGLDFIDDEKILVTNRDGEPCIFELPFNTTGSFELEPLAIIRSNDIFAPGSVAVIKNERGLDEALICNNYANSVTKHPLGSGAGYKSNNSEVFLKKWLDVPDSICVSKGGEWIAVSSHNTHAVLVYENNPSLNEFSPPAGVLRRVSYPHGLRFTSDGRFILVADAGSPHVNIYEKGNSDWRGLHDPLLSFKVLKDEDFSRGQIDPDGRYNPEEGGPKGIDVSEALNVFVCTCESEPLAFFDLGAILEGARARSSLPRNRAHGPRNLKALGVSYDLNLRRMKDGLRQMKSGVLLRSRKSTDRTTRLLRGMAHPSFSRIARYYLSSLARHTIGLDSIVDRPLSSPGEQSPLSVPKEMPPEPINGEEISRVVFQTWKSRVDIPRNYRYWRGTFLENNPEFQHVLWDDADNDEFIADKFSWFLPIYKKLPAGIFRSDAVRPFFLFLYGGVYADMDTECLRPLLSRPFSGDVILGQMRPNLSFVDSIPNAIMASKPFQLFWLLVVAIMIEKVERLGSVEEIRKAGPEFTTGPYLLHEAFNYYRSASEEEVRVRTGNIIANLPEHVSVRIKAGRIELLPAGIWYPLDHQNPIHWRFRKFLLRDGMRLTPAEARLLFPKANLLTYWTHSW